MFSYIFKLIHKYEKLELHNVLFVKTGVLIHIVEV